MELYSECLRHATLSMKLARKDHYRRELADSYAMMAKTERVMGINDLGAQNFMNAMEIFNELGDRRNTRLARCWAAVTIGLVVVFFILNLCRQSYLQDKVLLFPIQIPC